MLTPDLPMEQWRCTHGHKWESPVKMVGLLLQGEVWGLAPEEHLEFCGKCLVERLKTVIGQVREC